MDSQGNTLNNTGNMKVDDQTLV